jgi:hypothetical protein
VRHRRGVRRTALGAAKGPIEQARIEAQRLHIVAATTADAQRKPVSGTLRDGCRAGWRLLWRWKSRPGRPPIPLELRQLIRRMAIENPLWGEERIANELLLKLAIRLSPRTVRRYMPKRPPGCPRGDQRWSTFLRNHAKAAIACDFFVAVTLSCAG